MALRLSSVALIGLFLLPAAVIAQTGAVDVPILGPSGTYHEHIGVTSWNALKNKGVVHQQYDFSCGSASLTTVLQEYIGLKVSETDAMNGMLRYGETNKIIERRGFSLLDMKRYTAQVGYRSAGFKAEFADLSTLEHPGIVPIKYGGFDHFVVLKSVHAGHVMIADPALGNFTMTTAQFQKFWNPQVVFVVYPKVGEAKGTGLALSDNDLSFVGEDRIRRTALLEIPGFWSALQNTNFQSVGVR
ncbi:MAG: C39 family peptidase [Pseudomonadota bacterium]|jgi:predicted double-glycine peptidase